MWFGLRSLFSGTVKLQGQPSFQILSWPGAKGSSPCCPGAPTPPERPRLHDVKGIFPPALGPRLLLTGWGVLSPPGSLSTLKGIFIITTMPYHLYAKILHWFVPFFRFWTQTVALLLGFLNLPACFGMPYLSSCPLF